MSTPIPRMTADELRRMKSAALLIRFIECDRRLERMPSAAWLYQRREDAFMELEQRRLVGTLSPALCGIWDHHLTVAGGIRPCDCHEQ